MNALWDDLWRAARTLVRNPGFTAAAGLTIAVGIAANAVVFGLVDTVLFRPLPVREPEKLVGLYRKIPTDPSFNRFSYPNYLDVRDRSHSFSGLAAYYFAPFNLSVAGASERVFGKIVTGNYFEVLGVEMALGRAFLPEEDRVPNERPVAIVSHALWKNRLGADPAALGRSIVVNGQAFTLVGVTAESFRGTEVGMVPSVFVPMMMQSQAMPGQDWLDNRSTGWLRVVGRLKPATSLADARAETQVLGEHLRREHPDANQAFGIALVSSFGVHPQFRGTAQRISGLLLGLVALVLLIVCANVANLVLVRATQRRQEMGVRLALGASQLRVARQALVESLLLGLFGGALGLLLTPWGLDALRPVLQTAGLPSAIDLSVDRRLLMFTALVSVLAAVLVGLAPALQAGRRELLAVLKDEGQGRASGRSRLRGLFAAAQVAACAVLLVTAALCFRSLGNAVRIDPGFRAAGVATVSFDLGLQGYDARRGSRFLEDLRVRLSALPGVESVTHAAFLPLNNDNDTTVYVAGYAPPSGTPGAVINFNWVGPDYFRTLGIPIVRGREFGPEDTGPPSAVIVNETAARRFWPGQEPVGQRVGWGPRGPYAQVVGVARDARYVSLGEAPLPYLYGFAGQNYQASVSVLAHTTADPAPLVAALEAAVHVLDKDLPVYRATTLPALLDQVVSGPRLAVRVVGTLAMVALFLAALGLYAVLAHAVSSRTTELGIRMALGAQGTDILRLVLGEGARWVGVGLIAGLVGAAAALPFVRALFYDVRPHDPADYAAVAAVLSSVALVACYLPARRAMRTDPARTLRRD
jgi:putative ABC transport system permease protein